MDGGFWGVRDESDTTWLMRWASAAFARNSFWFALGLSLWTLLGAGVGAILGYLNSVLLHDLVARYALRPWPATVLALVIMALPLFAVVSVEIVCARWAGGGPGTILLRLPLWAVAVVAADAERYKGVLSTTAAGHLSSALLAVTVSAVLAAGAVAAVGWRRRSRSEPSDGVSQPR